MKPAKFLGAALASLALVLGACGGGGGIGGTGGGGGGGIGGTGVAYGSITGFGSVWVNGVEYASSGAEFRRDGALVTQNELHVGMVARVNGDIAGKTAASISVDSALKGRVEQVIDANQMVVLGQKVEADASTVFGSGVRPVVGDIVEVHGLPVSDGIVAAGYVERRAALASPPFKVTGFVKAHDTAAATFAIGTLTVHYAGASRANMPAGVWDGQLVQVKGSTCAGNPVCASLTATVVEPSGPRVQDIAEAEFEGFVNSLTANGFVFGGQTVVVTPATVFENGVAADVVVGVKLEVEGAIAGGLLTATKVSLRDNVRIEGDIASGDGTNFTIAGLPGITIQGTGLTELQGDNDFTLATLQAPNHVRIRGRLAAGNTVIATELELRSLGSDSTVKLRGPVTAAADPMLTVLGLAIDTSGASSFKLRDGGTAGRAAFFAALAVGDSVQAQGNLVAGALNWERFEIDD
jgi:cytoskeletal protein CcmA (bactofilin family)